MDAWMTTPGNHTGADPDIGQSIADIVDFVIITVVAVSGIIGNILNLVVIPQIPEETMGGATQVLFIALSLADLMTAVMLLIYLFKMVYFIKKHSRPESRIAVSFTKYTSVTK